MKASRHLLYSTAASAVILGFAIYLQEELPVAQSPVTLPQAAPCRAPPAAGAGQAGALAPAGADGAGELRDLT